MTSNRDKYVIECWLRLYNRLMGTSFVVVDWPDIDSSKQNIDAISRDNSGSLLGIEHTLIQPFAGEKADAARFMRALASLENHADLLQPGTQFQLANPWDICALANPPTAAAWG